MKRLLLGVAMMFTALGAQAQKQLPTQVDLRAAYCIEVNNQIIPASNKMVAVTQNYPDHIKRPLKADYDDLIHRQNKLRGYLLPRIPHLDSLGLVLAINSAREDVSKGITEMTSCNSKCSSEKDFPCIEGCLKTKTPTIERTQSRSDISFLPY